MRIMLLYPLMSVAVQELVYRTFFFHRYGVLFGSAWWLAILLNGVLFGIGHMVIGTPLAIYGTMVTGALFAWRYAMTRSFWAVFIEHTLWGALVFTVGLGRYFFTGVGILYMALSRAKLLQGGSTALRRMHIEPDLSVGA